jgi:RNase P/RNase MRP subunit p29
MGAKIRVATEDGAEKMVGIYTPVVVETANSFEEQQPGH